MTLEQLKLLQGMDWGSLPEHLIKEEVALGLLSPVKIEVDPVMPNVGLRFWD